MLSCYKYNGRFLSSKEVREIWQSLDLNAERQLSGKRVSQEEETSWSKAHLHGHRWDCGDFSLYTQVFLLAGRYSSTKSLINVSCTGLVSSSKASDFLDWWFSSSSEPPTFFRYLLLYFSSIFSQMFKCKFIIDLFVWSLSSFNLIQYIFQLHSCIILIPCKFS